MTEMAYRLKNGGQVRNSSYRCPNEINNRKGDCASSVTTTARTIGEERKSMRERERKRDKDREREKERAKDQEQEGESSLVERDGVWNSKEWNGMERR